MYAYERNIWAEHWFREMYKAEQPHDFWRYSVLFAKIIDGRFDVWETTTGTCGEPFNLFWPSVKSKLQQRVKKWKGHREKKLFGDNAPPHIFLCH